MAWWFILRFGLATAIRAHAFRSRDLCSDATGYLSFDLQRLIDAGVDSAGAVLVSAPQLGLRDKDLLGDLISELVRGGSDSPETGASSTRLCGDALLDTNEDVVSEGSLARSRLPDLGGQGCGRTCRVCDPGPSRRTGTGHSRLRGFSVLVRHVDADNFVTATVANGLPLDPAGTGAQLLQGGDPP